MSSPLTTHVLDTARGRPAAGLGVTLARLDGDTWRDVASGQTNEDGRVTDLLTREAFSAGTWRLTFHTGPWLTAQKLDVFYPRALVEFVVTAPEQHHHIPLLLSPFGYSTYRGS